MKGLNKRKGVEMMKEGDQSIKVNSSTRSFTPKKAKIN